MYCRPCHEAISFYGGSEKARNMNDHVWWRERWLEGFKGDPEAPSVVHTCGLKQLHVPRVPPAFAV